MCIPCDICEMCTTPENFSAKARSNAGGCIFSCRVAMPDGGKDDDESSEYSEYSEYDGKQLAYEERLLDYEEALLERDEKAGVTGA